MVSSIHGVAEVIFDQWMPFVFSVNFEVLLYVWACYPMRGCSLSEEFLAFIEQCNILSKICIEIQYVFDEHVKYVFEVGAAILKAKL